MLVSPYAGVQGSGAGRAKMGVRSVSWAGHACAARGNLLRLSCLVLPGAADPVPRCVRPEIAVEGDPRTTAGLASCRHHQPAARLHRLPIKGRRHNPAEDAAEHRSSSEMSSVASSNTRCRWIKRRLGATGMPESGEPPSRASVLTMFVTGEAEATVQRRPDCTAIASRFCRTMLSSRLWRVRLCKIVF